MDNLKSPISCFSFLDCGRRPENQERTHARTARLHVDSTHNRSSQVLLIHVPELRTMVRILSFDHLKKSLNGATFYTSNFIQVANYFHSFILCTRLFLSAGSQRSAEPHPSSHWVESRTGHAAWVASFLTLFVLVGPHSHQEPEDQQYFSQFVTLQTVRRAIHVGNLAFNDGSAVEKHLLLDVMQSVKPWLGVLMDHYRVSRRFRSDSIKKEIEEGGAEERQTTTFFDLLLISSPNQVMIYSGQLDVIVAAPLTERFLPTVNWTGAAEYKKAPRFHWKVQPEDTEVAGYVRGVREFYQVSRRERRFNQCDESHSHVCTSVKNV